MLAGAASADSLMRGYWRHQPRLGARDRRHIADVLYRCLRRRRTLERLWHQAGGTDPDPEQLAGAALVWAGTAPAALGTGATPTAATLERLARLPSGAEVPPVLDDLPAWLSRNLITQWGQPEALALAAALLQPAPLDLRVNTLKANRNQVQQELQSAGYPFAPTPLSPVGLRSPQPVPLQQTATFRQGRVEVQDEGSQLLAPLLAPRRRELIVDLCAGAGGKTLHLGALMADSGALYAFDVDPKRLQRMQVRLQRAGLGSVRAARIQGDTTPALHRLQGKADRVLIDAPCSGTGTIRRHPEILWQTHDVAALTARQDALLDTGAALLVPGGRLVYATCSLLGEENQQRVEAFCGRHPGFSVLNAWQVLARRGITPPATDQPWLRLLPHRHGTDGFFAAVLEKERS